MFHSPTNHEADLPGRSATPGTMKWTGLYPFGICYFAGSALFGGVVAPFVPSTYSRPQPPKPQSPAKK